jgi:hypothetical protein
LSRHGAAVRAEGAARHRHRLDAARGYALAVRSAVTAREISALLLRDPGSLDTDDQSRRTSRRNACPELDRLANHVTRFAVMLTGLRGDRLDAWLSAVDADGQPELRSFAAGIRRDYGASTMDSLCATTRDR